MPSDPVAPLALRIAEPSDEVVRAFLAAHRAEMEEVTPEGSVYALEVDGLSRPDVTLWTAHRDSTLVGCGALREIAPDHGEIKAMRTAPEHRRTGVAVAVLSHLVGEARRRGYARLSLETGSSDAFTGARALYANAGFVPCGPFAEYGPDPHSFFITQEL